MHTARPSWMADNNGGDTGVVLSLRRHRHVMEDLHDLAVVAEWRREKSFGIYDLKRRLD